MKELGNELGLIKPAEENVRDVNERKRYGYMGSMLLKKGLKLYSYDPRTKEIEEVKIDRQAQLTKKKDIKYKGKAGYNSNFLYVQALNKKNALRKALKMLAEINRLEKLKTK